MTDETFVFHPEHEPGCPARYGDGDCDEAPADVAARREDLERERTERRVELHRGEASGYFVPAIVAGERHFLLTSKGLERLGFYGLAAEQREAARRRLTEQADARRVAIERLGAPGTGLYEANVTAAEIYENRTKGNPFVDDLDSPAGAGHEVEADRG